MPVTQIDAVYGIRDITDTISTTSNGGTTAQNDATTGFEWVCTTSTNAAGSASLATRRAVRYRAGFGSLYRFTARFSSPKANSFQFAGCGNIGCALGFGYNGTEFGILYRNSGRAEIRRLTVSVGAGGAETATVTLNGVAFTVNLTAGTAKHAAFQIASATFAGWSVSHNGATVTFVATTSGVRSGTYSFSSTGTAAGTIAQVRSGGAYTDTWIPQSQWNIDKMDGRGPSGLTLDQTKGNVFEIQHQYLGYGMMSFALENSGWGVFQEVHRIENANKVSGPTLINPIMRLFYEATNLGNTSSLAVYGASAAGFVEGNNGHPRNPDGHGNSKTGVGTTFTNILSIRVRREFQGRLFLGEVLPVFVSWACSGTRPAEAALILNGVIAGEPDWTYENQSLSSVEYDTTGTTVTLGASSKTLAQFALAQASSEQHDISDWKIYLIAGDTLTLAVRSSTSTVDATCGVTWIDD
jgi:hypothetical protein